MTNMTGSKLSIFSHPGEITGYQVPLVRLRQNKQLPVTDDNMASNERFIQISETDTETFIQSMKNDILANINLSKSIKYIENYEGRVNVKDSNTPKGRFSMFANASISNVTINIYGNDGASALIGN